MCSFSMVALFTPGIVLKAGMVTRMRGIPAEIRRTQGGKELGPKTDGGDFVFLLLSWARSDHMTIRWMN